MYAACGLLGSDFCYDCWRPYPFCVCGKAVAA